MMYIVSLCYPFKIGRMIISIITIFVIYYSTIKISGNKVFCHKSMHHKIFISIIIY